MTESILSTTINKNVQEISQITGGMKKHEDNL